MNYFCNSPSITHCLLYCRLLITFANSLEPDQARQNIGLDLDQNCLTLKLFFEYGDFEKKTTDDKTQFDQLSYLQIVIVINCKV